jgi:hypothetical protein
MEIYAKSSTGKVILAKRVVGGELYLQVGRKDASLTDAEREYFAIRTDAQRRVGQELN